MLKKKSKSLIEWTLGVNFINIFSIRFLYESALRSFSLVTFWLCNFFGKRILTEKSRLKYWWNCRTPGWYSAAMSNNILLFATFVTNKMCICHILKTYLKANYPLALTKGCTQIWWTTELISWAISVQNFRFIKLFLTEKFQLNWKYLVLSNVSHFWSI